MLFDRLFRNNKVINGQVVDLVLEKSIDAISSKDNIASNDYGIYIHDTKDRVGYCDLRMGYNDELYYAGNIGYRINKEYRGHHYAYYACLMLLEIAKNDYDLNYLIITCSPENIASKRTIEMLNGQYLETTDVPKTHWLYKRGETVKNIYKCKL